MVASRAVAQARRQSSSAKTPAPRARRTRKAAPVEPRVRILDSAEALFAERGYYGASMRDIAKAADVVPSHVVYAFGTKEELFVATLARRIDELVQARAQRLEEVESAKKPGLEAILRSYIAPLLERSENGGEGWRKYGQLIAQVANQRKTFELESMNSVFDKLDKGGHGLIVSIRRAVPGLGQRDAIVGFLFFASAMLTIFAETGRIERLTANKCHSHDLDALCVVLVPFCSGGFRALAK